MFKVALLVLGSLLASLAATAAPVPTTIRTSMAPSGTLRAGINFNNPLLARRDPATGELSGIAVDLSRQLARRLGVPVELLPYESAGKMAADVTNDKWDIAYLAIDPERATTIDYSGPYLELEGTYLVPQDSGLQKIEDVDHDGIRIAVTAKSAYDLFLSRELKHAQLVRFETTPVSIDMMVAQKLDAVAAVRTALVAGAHRVPGSRVMSGHFMTIPQAAGVPSGRPEAAHYLQAFIEDMKTSGFVAESLKKHGLGPDDALVAPAQGQTGGAVYTAAYIEIKSSAITSGVALAQQYARNSQAEAGNLAVSALQETGRTNRFVIVEAWRDQASFDDHAKSAHALQFLQKLAAIEAAPYDQRINHGFAIDPQPGKAGSNAVYVVTHVDVPGARREEAEALLQQLSGPSRTVPGHLRYDLYQQNDPRANHFTLYAIWRNRADFEAYGSTQHCLEFRDAITPLLGALYDERVYRLIGP